MPSSNRPIRARSDMAEDMANDLRELRRLKELQARIFDELRRREDEQEIQRRESEMASLLQLSRMLLGLVEQTRRERDALAAELAERRETPRLDDIIERLADALHARNSGQLEEEPPAPSRSYSRRGPMRVDRRALGGGYAPAAAPDRMAWALRS